MKTRLSKKSLLVLAALALCVQSAPALITIPLDFPLGSSSTSPSAERSHLEKLVSVYRNDVVLVANPEESFAKEIREQVGTPATREKLTNLATAGGSELTPDSLAAAAAALTRQNPTEAPVVMASAMELLTEKLGKVSVDDRYLVGRGVISGIPYNQPQRHQLVSAVIGVGARGLKVAKSSDLLRRLREYAINDLPFKERDFKEPDFKSGNAPGSSPTMGPQQAAEALALDQALAEDSIIGSYMADPQFLTMANNFATEQMADTFFSGDQGTINQGQIFTPGAAGSAGGSGSSGSQLSPNPKPTPKPPAS